MAIDGSGNLYMTDAYNFFGDPTFHGSAGGSRLNQPIVAMAGTP